MYDDLRGGTRLRFFVRPPVVAFGKNLHICGAKTARILICDLGL